MVAVLPVFDSVDWCRLVATGIEKLPPKTLDSYRDLSKTVEPHRHPIAQAASRQKLNPEECSRPVCKP